MLEVTEQLDCHCSSEAHAHEEEEPPACVADQFTDGMDEAATDALACSETDLDTTSCTEAELAEIDAFRLAHCGGDAHPHDHCHEAPPTCLTELDGISTDDHEQFDMILCADTLDTSTCSEADMLEVTEQLDCHCSSEAHAHEEEEPPECVHEQVVSAVEEAAIDALACSETDL